MTSGPSICQRPWAPHSCPRRRSTIWARSWGTTWMRAKWRMGLWRRLSNRGRRPASGGNLGLSVGSLMDGAGNRAGCGDGDDDVVASPRFSVIVGADFVGVLGALIVFVVGAKQVTGCLELADDF